MADIIEGVSPTRMELLDMNRRIKLAKKGHKLLKQKRDSLVTEFFGIIEQARGGRTELVAAMNKGYGDLIQAEALTGAQTTEGIASTVPEKNTFTIKTRNIMGVKIPKIEVIKKDVPAGEITGSAYTTTKLYESKKDFEKAYDDLVKLVETEETVRRLGEEIKKTKRRVNSLEYIMMPRLGATKKYITSRLEEMERESFFRLKMVKRKKQRAAKAKNNSK
jgi:V/A-type H+-transporting ATPase subunit D